MPAGILDRIRIRLGIQTADQFIARRYAENDALLRQRMTALEAAFLMAPEPAPDAPERRLWEETRALLALPRDSAAAGAIDWEAANRCEVMLTRFLPAAELPTVTAKRLADLAGLDPPAHAALAAEWTAMRAPDGAVDAARARGLLCEILKAAQQRETQRYLIRKLGVLYAKRLVWSFLGAILFALALVVWEVYADRWPLTDARFAGFAIVIAAGLLGASFSALIRQREIAGFANLEEVRTAIGLPMILLRLGLGVGGAAILYFFFESGLIEGPLFPDLNALGFAPVTVGGEAAAALEAARASLAKAAGALDGDAAAAREAILAAERALSGARPAELGRLVPNAALSKLVVWSFLAGFSEMLAPSLLARIEKTTAPAEKT